MSLEHPNVWGHTTTGRYTADLIGWDDESGHRHPGTPEKNDSSVDGLIVRVTDSQDPERSRVFTVYKGAGNRNPTPEQWLKRLIDASIRTGSVPGALEYDLSDGE